MEAKDQIEILRQCLTTDKRPIGFLLGAGCSASVKVVGESNGDSRALIPAVPELTQLILEKARISEDYRKKVDLATGQMQSKYGDEYTIEDLLSYIRSLRSVAGSQGAEGFSATDLDGLDQYICNEIHDLVNRRLPAKETPHNDFVHWIKALSGSPSVELFTPNYDLLLEEALDCAGLPYYDGFPGSHEPRFDAVSVDDAFLPPYWVRVWKLHGSINWFVNHQGEVIRSSNRPSDMPLVIHPSHAKHAESRQMPHLALFDRLRNFLRQPSATLFICGYSFEDAHINSVLDQGLRFLRTTVAYGLLYRDLDSHPQARELAETHPNMNLIARDGGHIAGSPIAWDIPDSHQSSKDTERDGATGHQPTQHELLSQLGDFAQFTTFLRNMISTFPGITDNDYAGR